MTVATESKFEWFYMAGLPATGAIFVLLLGNLNGLFGLGLEYRGWMYASLLCVFVGIACLLARKAAIMSIEARRDMIKGLTGSELMASGLHGERFAKEHPIKNRVYYFGRRISRRVAKPIGRIGLVFAVLSILFYLIFAITNLELAVSSGGT